MKHKVGDKVLIRSDLNLDVRYGIQNVVNQMLAFAGKKVTILTIDFGQYRIKEAGYLWTDEMFVDSPKDFLKAGGVVQFEDGKKSVIRETVDGKLGFMYYGEHYFDEYDADLSPKDPNTTRLVKRIYGLPSALDDFTYNVTSNRTVLWERKEKKTVSMDDIAKEFGCNVADLIIKKEEV